MSVVNRPRFILLAPPPPTDDTLVSYKDVYGETIAEVLKEVASHSTSEAGAAILEVALACPQLVYQIRSPRRKVYHQTQKQIALLYKLVVIIAARDGISVEDSTGADVRIIPVAWNAGGKSSVAHDPGYGPVVSIASLARSKRPWQYAFGVESEQGEQMVRAFVAAKNESSGDTNAPASDGAESTDAQISNDRHFDVAVGGTFDHLHIGHKLLLTMTLFAVDYVDGSSPASVAIGITGDELLKNKKYAEVLESWELRQQHIEDFCDSLLDFTSWPAQKATNHNRNESVPNGVSTELIYGNGLDVRCTQIQDAFGPTITDKSISALVISGETRSGGKAVNDKRKEKEWPELEIFEVDVLDADEEGVGSEGFEAKLSSTAIRQKLASKDKPT